MTSRCLICLGFISGLLLTFPLNSLAQDDETADAQTEQTEVIVINPQKALDELQAAYQKEYAFLDAQLRELQNRLSEFEATSVADEKEREAEIDRTEGDFINLQSRAERMNELLTDAERQIASAEDSRSTLEATFLQAGSTLEPFGLAAIRTEEFLASNDEQKIDILFDRTRRLVTSLGQARKSDGSFFLVDGTEVNGSIIHIGNIASYGVSDQGSGALAPAGDEQFKIWSASTPETALALKQDQQPETVGIFLYESNNHAIEEKAGKTIISVVNSGGTIAWIIVGLGAVASLLVVLRVIFLRMSSTSTGRVAQDVGELVQHGKLDQALEMCKSLKGATGRVVGAAVRNLDSDREHVEDIVAEQILHESAHLNRFGAMIMVIAAVSPLLGLLGTVTGMISTFDIITEFGTGDPKLLSGGISIALVTTEVGLAVAIPALVFGNLLSSWAERIKDDMEKAALRVMNLYKTKPMKSTAVQAVS